MAIAIMQPTYLPWAGYFNLMNRVDRFIFLNNVKFEKSSWQTRNQILVNKQSRYITLPTTGSRLQVINEVLLNDNTPWRSRHIKTLEQAYKKTTYGGDILNCISPVIENNSLVFLQDITMAIIEAIAGQLHIHCTIFRSSDINTKGKRSGRLVELCQYFNDTSYFSPAGARQYIQQDGCLENAGITVEYQHYQPEPYPQKTVQTFVPYLSIVDVVAHIGWTGARQYIRSSY